MQATGGVSLGRSHGRCISISRGVGAAARQRPVPCRPGRSTIVAAGKGDGQNFWDKLTGDEGPFKNFGKGGGAGGSGGRGGGRPGGDRGADGDDGEGGPEKPIWEELKELFGGMWIVFWNTAMFLAFADVLHRSLDWCCQIELLLLVGAPQQAFERAASVFYSAIEGFERNLLGWDIPQDDDMIPMYENIALYYPEEHAYTFDAYRYKDMTAAEKQQLKYFYALRHYERDGGQPGEVDAADVQAIEDKYEPMEADRRAYQAAKAAGTIEQYWAGKEDTYRAMARGAGAPPAK